MEPPSTSSATFTSQKIASASASFSTTGAFKARSAGSIGRHSSPLAETAMGRASRHKRTPAGNNGRRENISLLNLSQIRGERSSTSCCEIEDESKAVAQLSTRLVLSWFLKKSIDWYH